MYLAPMWPRHERPQAAPAANALPRFGSILILRMASRFSRPAKSWKHDLCRARTPLGKRDISHRQQSQFCRPFRYQEFVFLRATPHHPDIHNRSGRDPGFVAEWEIADRRLGLRSEDAMSLLAVRRSRRDSSSRCAIQDRVETAVLSIAC